MGVGGCGWVRVGAPFSNTQHRQFFAKNFVEGVLDSISIQWNFENNSN